MSDDHEVAAFRAALAAGIELFNREDFEAAYETWFARWSEETTVGADLLQGLMQMAVGFAKLRAGEERAAAKLFDAARQKFDGYPADAYGVELASLRRQLDEWLARLGPIRPLR